METDIKCLRPIDAAEFVARDVKRIQERLNGITAGGMEFHEQLEICLQTTIDAFTKYYKELTVKIYNRKRELEFDHNIKLICTDIHTIFSEDNCCSIRGNWFAIHFTLKQVDR